MRFGLDDDRACRIMQCLAEWAWLVDHGAAGDAVRLYAPNAAQEIAGVRAEGVAAIGAALRRRAAMTQRTSRHVISNFRLTQLTRNEATAAWILTLYRSDTEKLDPVPLLVADVDDRFVAADGAWRIVERKVKPIFER